MPLEKLPPTTENNTVALGKMPKAAHPLELSTKKISQSTQSIMEQLKNLGKGESAAGDDISFELTGIGQAISQLPKVPKAMEELYKNTVYKSVFSIVETLYDE